MAVQTAHTVNRSLLPWAVSGTAANRDGRRFTSILQSVRYMNNRYPCRFSSESDRLPGRIRSTSDGAFRTGNSGCSRMGSGI